jgi:hypothetical protein
MGMPPIQILNKEGRKAGKRKLAGFCEAFHQYGSCIPAFLIPPSEIFQIRWIRQIRGACLFVVKSRQSIAGSGHKPIQDSNLKNQFLGI